MDPSLPIRVFLLDDHEVVRRGLRDLLESDGDIEVVGEAGTAAGGDGPHPGAAARRRRARRPAARRQRHRRLPGRPVGRPDDQGADPDLATTTTRRCSPRSWPAPRATCSSRSRGTDLVDAVRRVAAGQSLLDPSRHRAGAGAAAARPRGARPSWPALTEQERKILELIAEGLTNRQIGERMFLAEKTVKNYVSSILSKLGLERRTQAAVLASKLLR